MIEKLIDQPYWEDIGDAVNRLCRHENISGDSVFYEDSLLPYYFTLRYSYCILGITSHRPWEDVFAPVDCNKSAQDLIVFLDSSLHLIKPEILRLIQMAIIDNTKLLSTQGSIDLYAVNDSTTENPDLLEKAEVELEKMSSESNIQKLFDRYVEIVKRNSVRG